MKISVYSDYVCPFCFLAKQPLYEVLKEKDDINIEWIPLEQPMQSPLYPEDRLQLWREIVYPLAQKMGVSIILPNVQPYPSSRLASEGYYFARENGKADEYNDRLMHAFFGEQQNIGQINVLTRLAADIGLDKQAYREALEQRLYKNIHNKALHDAYNETGVTRTPLLVIGCTKVAGIQSKEEIECLIEQERKPKKKKISLLMSGQSCGPNGCQ
ncbi:DsbA family oxidoreductase [Domibacillus robiginosus]|uniref:DsbA family oxidoreductase n=1 Tax=Domibacillus robiginosus TaxID=1071054 RepID=UPI001FE1317F|nr:DsbA family protein [Domibacillus robiginosus]